MDVLPSVQGPWLLNLVLCTLNLRDCWYIGLVTWHNWWHLLDFSVSKIFFLQCHWLVSSKTGLLFEGHLPFQSSIPEESGSSHIQTTTFVFSPCPKHYTKKVIYSGTQHNELFPVYITTIIHNHSKYVVELLVAWLFTKPHVWKCSKQLWSNTVEGNWGQTPLNGIIGPHYADAFLIIILPNQVFPTHSLKYLWVYICLQTITRHKGYSSIHVSKSLDSTFG
jgi:hypothetical protein